MIKFVLVSLLMILNIQAKDSSMCIYDFNVKNIDGKEVSMSKYKDKVLLIVNVASECGLT